MTNTIHPKRNIKFRQILLLLSILLISVSSFSQNRKKEWFDGVWRGTGFQLNNSSSWSIKFVADTKSKTYKIEYGSLGCSGYWELSEVEKNRAIFIEKITDGKDKCINGNTIIITFVSKSYLSYSCFAPGSTVLDASATLERVEN